MRMTRRTQVVRVVCRNSTYGMRYGVRVLLQPILRELLLTVDLAAPRWAGSQEPPGYGA
mgnify:CR=1 FL=1